ncbi:flavin reductase family protein [Zhenpiania hominis]|uniref:Flavin reductase family protein n=1 Tax=Zhenpiania hominis TaxID=2763644 RepID=A0A923NI57_9FIRM|nr:flavin reductase family protein [Zhenpiania hominis]MBC6679471.1 flavin reductase family protein [Zhenpiania hominis]
MKKRSFKPGTMLNPVPVVMVSCGDVNHGNIITVAWTGIVNSDPPMTYVSIRKERYSHEIIKNAGDFVINLTTEELTFATDYCGVKSGRDTDKFKEQKLTPLPAEKVKAPLIAQSPVNLECKVKEIHEYGSHDMFIAEIVNVQAAEEWIDETGRIRLDKAGLICYNHGEYFGLRRQPLGRFGFSVMKPKTKKRLAAEQRRNTFRKKKQSRGRRL